MRILALTNLYPPHYIGGYELGCRDVLDGLVVRGHAVTVLTSRYGLARPAVEGNVHRSLRFYWDARSSPRRHLTFALQVAQDNALLARLIRRTAPDVVFVWNMRGLTKSLLHTAQRSGLPMAYCVSDSWLEDDLPRDRWLSFWDHPHAGAKARLKNSFHRLGLPGVLDRLLPTLPATLDLRFAYFTSRALKQDAVVVGYPVSECPVIPWGVDLGKFSPAAPSRTSGDSLRLLYVGQISEHKGAHVAVEALVRLDKSARSRFTLDLVGGLHSEEYGAWLRRLIHDGELEGRARLLGKRSRDEVRLLYCEYDALIFPSIWAEAFSITLLEALASGLPVAATLTGGSREILVPEANCLAFAPGQSDELAKQLLRLLDSGLRARLAEAGLRTVRQGYDLQKQTGKVEDWLAHSVRGRVGLVPLAFQDAA